MLSIAGGIVLAFFVLSAIVAALENGSPGCAVWIIVLFGLAVVLSRCIG